MDKVNLYIIGQCPICNGINAAAIDFDPNGDAEGIREAINEFLDCGHIVSAIRTSDRVELTGCRAGCPRNTLTKYLCGGDGPTKEDVWIG